MGRFRTVSLLFAGAYAVHTLRYALAYGPSAHGQLLRQGHAYLICAPYALTLALALLASHLLVQAARGGPGQRRARPLPHTWAVLALALLAMFVVQESAEGALAAGHPGGLAAVVGHGGWLAAPLSTAIGLALALLLRGTRQLLTARPARLRVPRARSISVALLPRAPEPPPRGVLGPWLRGRAPPALAG